MSRIGNAIINVPSGVEVKINGSEVAVKGPKGELKEVLDADMEVRLEENVLSVHRPSDQKKHKALHGLSRALLSNMVVGVSEGFTIKLELVGVGFKATVKGQVLDMHLGYSHPIVFALPEEIKASAETEKGKNPIVTLESSDKQLIGQVAAKIRSLRKIEPYKGKGVRFLGEEVRRKAGKTAAK